jgi:alpha-methylacyl-CoA racemase
MTGPLAGLTVIEMAGLGPTPFCGMLLADMGAEVIRVERTEPSGLGIDLAFDLRNRNKRSIALDMKFDAGRAALMRLVARADVLTEGFRPGVAERLGFGPDDCWKVSPRLVYGRATGWGQGGPLAQAAGHDINYIALSGALAMIGEPNSPAVPLNLLGDYAGGALYLAFGITCAVIEAQRSGQGQVVDAAMLDGINSLLTVFHGFRQSGALKPRGENILDGGAPYYRCYPTRDGGFMAVGAIEPKFYAILLDRLGLDPATLPKQNDRAGWPDLAARFAERFAERTRAEWEAVFDGSDACVSPVLSLDEAGRHPHVQARGMFVTLDGIDHPQPAPRLSRTPGAVRWNDPKSGADTEAVLRDKGFSDAEIAALTKVSAG